MRCATILCRFILLCTTPVWPVVFLSPVLGLVRKHLLKFDKYNGFRTRTFANRTGALVTSTFRSPLCQGDEKQTMDAANEEPEVPAQDVVVDEDLPLDEGAPVDENDENARPNEDVPPEQDEPRQVEHGLIQFRDLLIILQHNGAEIDDRIPPGFVMNPNHYSFRPSPAPSVMNFASPWHLAACLVALIAIHIEIDSSWLLNHGYLHSGCRIISNVISTITIAFVRTIVYDIFGALAEFIRRKAMQEVGTVLAHMWNQMAPMDEQGLSRWFLPDELFFFVSNIFLTLSDFGFFVFLAIIKLIGWAHLRFLSPRNAESLAWLLSDDFFARNLSTSLLTTTRTGEPAIFVSIAWEILLQVLLQVLAATGFYLIGFFFFKKAEEPIIFGYNRRDSFNLCMYSLLRATATHTITGTAYQLLTVSLAIIEETPLLKNSLGVHLPWRPHARGALRMLLDQISPAGILYNIVASVLIYGFHAMLGICLQQATIALSFLCRPFVVWLTLFNHSGVEAGWVIFEAYLMDDTSVVHWLYRERALMTLLFGAKSSWPIRTTYH